MGVAASQMERRGIQTDKGSLNREITEHNKLLKEIKARLARLNNWSKEQSQKPQGKESIMAQLIQMKLDTSREKSRSAKIKSLKEGTKLFNFLMISEIHSLQDFHEMVSAMNKEYYDLRGRIVDTERRISTLTERLQMYAQYEQNRRVYKRLSKLKPEKRKQLQQEHSAEIVLYEAAVRYLDKLKASGENVNAKQWRAERTKLITHKNLLYQQMRDMRKDIKTAEDLRKAARQFLKEEQSGQKIDHTR